MRHGDDKKDRVLEHVDALTRPRTVVFVQYNRQGISCRSLVEHPPLIVQLRMAVGGAIGSKGAKGTSGAERVPINPAAVELLDSITRTIWKWLADYVGANTARQAIPALRRWYVEFEYRRRMGLVNQQDERYFESRLSRWERAINDLFDPARIIELTEQHREPVVDPETGVQRTKRKRIPGLFDADGSRINKYEKVPQWKVTTTPAACPECGQRFAYDGGDIRDRVVALVVQYRPSDERMLESAWAKCRACGTVWEGNGGLAVLRAAMEAGSNTPADNALSIARNALL